MLVTKTVFQVTACMVVTSAFMSSPPSPPRHFSLDVIWLKAVASDRSTATKFGFIIVCISIGSSSTL